MPQDERERKRLYARERRARLIAAGLCPTCGLRPPDDGARQCAGCQEAHRLRQRDLRRGLGPSPSGAIWHCDWCGGRGHQERSCSLAEAGTRRLAPEIEERIGGLP